MSELRYNIATGDWVLVAPERARRPEDFREDARPSTHDRPSHREGCPFCPGGEDNTPGESLRYLNESGDWLVRSFPNRFPAVRKEMHNEQTGDRFHRKRNGHGLHEVLAESRLHNATLALQPVSEVELVLRAWRERFLSVARMPGIDHVVIFKNHGAAAGSSLEHPHSQIVGLPVIPSPVRGRMQVAWSHYRKYGRCVFCEVLTCELEDRDRVIESNADFVAFVPFAAYSPFSIWILPRRHHHCFGLVNDQEISALATLLQDVLARLYNSLGDPDYNLVIRSAHPPGPGSHFFHWYIAIVPRLAKLAGFEMGTGMFINGSSPEGDAASLRICATVHW
jgi:UDPglucose--hexose-1-phosphate uridylyltransferase